MTKTDIDKLADTSLQLTIVVGVSAGILAHFIVSSYLGMLYGFLAGILIILFSLTIYFRKDES